MKHSVILILLLVMILVACDDGGGTTSATPPGPSCKIIVHNDRAFGVNLMGGYWVLYVPAYGTNEVTVNPGSYSVSVQWFDGTPDGPLYWTIDEQSQPLEMIATNTTPIVWVEVP